MTDQEKQRRRNILGGALGITGALVVLALIVGAGWLVVSLVDSSAVSSGGNKEAAASAGPAQTASVETGRVATPITKGYDTASCADWKVTGPSDRQILVLYYAIEFSDPQPSADAASLTNLITTSCDSYGASETPRHIAKVSIAAVYGS